MHAHSRGYGCCRFCGAMTNSRECDVAVVVVNHNQAEYVELALASVLGQTCQPREIVVVDDGSTDESPVVIQRALDSDPRSRVVRLPGVGVAQARNAGAAKATARWVVFLDADDMLHPTFLQRTVSVAARCNTSPAYVYTDAVLAGAEQGVARARRFSALALKRSNFVWNCCLMDRGGFIASGGYRSDLSSHEDWDLFLTLLELGHWGKYLPEPLFTYRRHFEGSRNSLEAQQLLSMRESMMIRHASLYRSPLVRAFVTDGLPGTASLAAMKRRFRPRRLRH